MPIKVDYSPVGLAGSLAIRSGQAAAGRVAQQTALQQQQLALQASAQKQRAIEANRAFTLQAAQMSRQAAVQDRAFDLQKAAAMKTPVADFVGQQLKSMQTSGALTGEQAQRARLAQLTDNKAMMRDVISPQQDKLGLDMIRQPFQSQRRVLESQLKSIGESLADPITAQMGQAEAQKERATGIRSQLDKVFQDEANAVAGFRARASGTKAASTGSTKGTKGMTVLSRPPGWSDTEKEIDQILRRDTGQGATVRGERSSLSTFGASGEERIEPAPASPGKRTSGQMYILPDGRRGIWRGTGWEVL